MLLVSRSCFLHRGPGRCGFRVGLSFAVLEVKFLSFCSSFSAHVNLIRPTHSPEITSVSQVPNNSSVLENFLLLPSDFCFCGPLPGQLGEPDCLEKGSLWESGETEGLRVLTARGGGALLTGRACFVARGLQTRLGVLTGFGLL